MMKGELEAIGEEYENIDSVSKIQTQIYNLTNGSVNIMDDLDPTKFKSTYEIMKQISKVWSDISQTDQAALLETIAGKQRGNQIAAILSAFQSGQIDKALETSINSQNSALNEQKKYMEGIEYSADRLKASMQELSATSLDSSTVKWFVDFANGAVNATTAMGGLGTAVILLGTAFGVHKFLLPILVKEMSALAVAEGFAESTTMGMIVKQQGLNKSFALGSTAVKSFLSSMLPLLAVAAVIGGIVVAYDLANTSLKEQMEILDKAKQRYEDNTTELKSLNTELQTTQDRINELNALPNLTFTEQSELETLQRTNDELERSIELEKVKQQLSAKSVVNEIANTYDSYKKKYGDMSSYGDNKKAIQDYVYQSNVAISTAPDYYSGDFLNEYITNKQKELDNWNGELDKLKSSYLTYASQLEDWIQQFETLGVDNLTVAQKGTYDGLKSDLDNIYKKVLSATEYKEIVIEPKFDIAFNKSSFSEAKAQLEDLAKSGELTPDVISSNKEYSKLLSETGLSAQEVTNQITALVSVTDEVAVVTSNAEEELKAFNDALTSLSDSDKALTDIKAEVEEFGAISMGTINSLMEKYPQLTDVLYDYLNGLSSTKDVVNALSNVYATDLENWKTLQLSKYENNEEFLKLVGGNNSELINTMLSDYGIDLSNNQSYLQSKMQILNKYLGQAGGAWLKYYDIASGKTINLGGLSSGEQYSISKAASEANQALAVFNQGLDFSGIESNFKTSNGEFKTEKTDKAKKAAEEAEKARQEEIQKVKDKFAKKDDANKFLLDMGLIKEKTYYKRLKELNDEYFKDKADFLAEDRQNQVSYHNWEVKAEKEKLDKIKSLYDTKSTYAESKVSKRESLISLRESQGKPARTSDYDYLIKLQNDIISNIKAESEAYSKVFNEQVKSGIIKKGSAEYQEGLSYINSLTAETREAESAIYDYKTEIRDIKWDSFDKGVTKINNIKDELSGLADLISNDDAIGDTGNYTDAGVTKLGLYAEQINENKKLISEYNKAIASIGTELKKGTISQAQYDEELANYKSLQRDAVSSTQSLEDAIISLAETRVGVQIDAINKETDAVKNSIDAKKKELDAEQKLHDYKEANSEKTDEIVTLQKKIAALKLSTDRKDIAQRLKLEEELGEKQKSLEEDQYKNSMDTKNAALDDELTSYEKSQQSKIDILEKSLEDQNTLVKNALNEAFINTSTVSDGIKSLASEHGITITNSIVSPWTSATNAITLYKNALNGLSSNSNILAGITFGANIAIGSKTTKLNGYKTGIEKVLEDQLAWTQENGGEIQTRPSSGAVLTPLQKGDGIINADLTKNLMEWGKINPLKSLDISSKLPKFESFTSNRNGGVSIHYDTLLNVEGSIDKSIDVQGMIAKAIDKSQSDLITIIKQKK